MGYRRRYRYSYRSGASLPTRTCQMTDYWALKRLKHAGLELRVSFMCSGNKLHHIIFRDRGPVTLENHNLKAEKLLKEFAIDGIDTPRCIQLLKGWRAGTARYEGIIQSISNTKHKQINPIVQFREMVRNHRVDAKRYDDADCLESHISKRLHDTIQVLSADLEARVRTAFLHEARQTPIKSYRLDVTKLKVIGKFLSGVLAKSSKHEPKKLLEVVKTVQKQTPKTSQVFVLKKREA